MYSNFMHFSGWYKDLAMYSFAKIIKNAASKDCFNDTNLFRKSEKCKS